jgi:hypothetical protein
MPLSLMETQIASPSTIASAGIANQAEQEAENSR